MASPNSRNTDNPQKVRMPPMIHRKSDTPTEPVTAKIPEGVEKTAIEVSGYLGLGRGCTYCRYRSSCSGSRILWPCNPASGSHRTHTHCPLVRYLPRILVGVVKFLGRYVALLLLRRRTWSPSWTDRHELNVQLFS
jgi:hypothetical protein